MRKQNPSSRTKIFSDRRRENEDLMNAKLKRVPFLKFGANLAV
jgi:hypothetical protein